MLCHDPSVSDDPLSETAGGFFFFLQKQTQKGQTK